MRTIKELAEYFDIPYSVVYGAVRDVKAYGKHNQRFHIDVAKMRILQRLESQKARAMEKIACCDGLIRRVQSKGGKEL